MQNLIFFGLEIRPEARMPGSNHPLHRFLATAVWDNSWRLWDLEQLTEVKPFPVSLLNSFDETLNRSCIKKVTARRCTLLPFKMMEHLPALEVNLLNHLPV